MVPMRGCWWGSTTSVRDTPSALGLPGQSAARAAWAAKPPRAAKAKAACRHHRTPHHAQLMKKLPSPMPTDHAMLECECGLNCQTSTPVFEGLVPAGRRRSVRLDVNDVIAVVAKIP